MGIRPKRKLAVCIGIGGEDMGAVTIQQMADRIAALMEDRLGIKGSTLSEKLAQGGNRLPHRVRRQARVLADSAEAARNPALLVQVDEARVAKAYDICVRHLHRIGPWARRGGAALRFARAVMGSLLITAVLVAAVLIWRGYL